MTSVSFDRREKAVSQIALELRSPSPYFGLEGDLKAALPEGAERPAMHRSLEELATYLEELLERLARLEQEHRSVRVDLKYRHLWNVASWRRRSAARSWRCAN